MSTIDVDALINVEVDSSPKAMCYKTVDVFSGILKRRLWLKNSQDGVARTNGYLIEVPFQHPRAYQYCEHEISHILFQSDFLAKQKFIEEYSRKIGQVAKKAHLTINERMLRAGLEGIVGVLDDERVISLWGLLYRGSGAIMRRMKREESAAHLNLAHQDFLSLFICVASGNPIPPGKLDRFVPYMEEALRKVRFRDYFGCLVAAKWLVVQLVSEIIRESRGEDPPPGPAPQLGSGSDGASGDEDEQQAGEGSNPQEPSEDHPDETWEPPEVDAGLKERSQALQDAINRLGKAPSDISSEVGESKYKKRGEEAAADRRAQAAITANVKNASKLEDILDASSAQMLRLVDKARNATKNAFNHDDRIRHESYAKVVFTDVEPSGPRSDSSLLNDEDENTVKRLRAMFHRVLGRRINTLEDAGTRLDVPAYITRRMTGEPLPVFAVDSFGRGFRTLVLVDRSSSMQGRRTAQAERACRIISRALDFPFVTSRVWGFQSLKDGQVDITRFRPRQEVFESATSRVGGTTPLHTAIRVALKDLEDGTDRKHLFVISDGFPIFVRNDGAQYGTRALMSFVRMNIQNARRKGIGVTGVLIGSDVGAKEMGKMFGPPRNWRIMKDQTFGHDLVQLVTGAFVSYLRGG